MQFEVPAVLKGKGQLGLLQERQVPDAGEGEAALADVQRRFVRRQVARGGKDRIPVGGDPPQSDVLSALPQAEGEKLRACEFALLPEVPFGEVRKGRALPGQKAFVQGDAKPAGAADVVPARRQRADAAAGGTHEEQGGDALRAFFAPVGHAFRFLVREGVLRDLPEDQAVDLLRRHRAERFGGMDAGDDPPDPAPAEGARPAGQGKVAAVNAVGDQGRAGGLHQGGRARVDLAGEPVPGGLALGEDAHAFARAQGPEGLQGRGGAAGALAPEDDPERAEQQRPETGTQPEDVFAGDIDDALSGRGPGQEDRVQVGDVVADDQAGPGVGQGLHLKPQISPDGRKEQADAGPPDPRLTPLPVHGQRTASE